MTRRFLRPGDEPLLDVGAGTGLWTRAFAAWFDAEVVALEPSSGMREMGDQIGPPSRACYVAASAEHLPFGRPVFRAAWLSTVVHHLTDLSACAGDLRRALTEGASVMIRNSFPGRLEVVDSSGTSPPLRPWPPIGRPWSMSWRPSPKPDSPRTASSRYERNGGKTCVNYETGQWRSGIPTRPSHRSRMPSSTRD